MLASSFTDPILGIDIHWELIPTPAPTPMPIPNPFTGIVFDPLGLAAGAAISAAMSAVLGTPFQGPVIYWGAFPATNTGTEGIHVPGHILIPPGTGWAPVPRTPKPVIRPGETPDPPKPISPDNDAIAIFGSKTVSVMGSNAVRMGDIFLSCSEPIRLPSSVVIAIPKGAPILIGGPPSLDLMAAIMASLRTRFMSDSLHALVSRLSPGRFRNLLHRAVCFFTGHPVDVASGKVLCEAVDAALPGPLPLQIDRIYSSAFADREGRLGHGWSSSLEQAVWRERGKVVLRSEDGREIEFDTFDLPEHRIEPGQSVYTPFDRLTLRCLADEVWEVEAADGVVRSFRPVAGDRQAGGPEGPIARIESIRDRANSRRIGFFYDDRGCLEWIRDSVGRLIQIQHDRAGRMTELRLPKAHGEGWASHRSYRYDDEGDLIEVVDATGASWRYEYVTHLLTRERDRTGFSYYFTYDGYGADAWCTRTWGDEGMFDHTLVYDKRKHVTFVTDSLGHTTEYRMNVAGMVTTIIDPLRGVTEHTYDPVTLRRIATCNPAGEITRFAYDARGNLECCEYPDATKLALVYDANNQVVQAIDALEGVWSWRYDTLGRVSALINPLGEVTEHGWERGLPAWVRSPGGHWVRFGHDEHGLLRSISDASGAETRMTWDGLGRRTAITEVGGTTLNLRHDAESRLVELARATGETQRRSYDAEGHLVAVEDGRRRIRLRYGPGHRVIAREEGELVRRYEYDREGRMIAEIDELGRRHELVRDPLGRVIVERRAEGGEQRYAHDPVGRVIEVRSPAERTAKLAYDPRGRLIDVVRTDGSFTKYGYRADGALIEASNQSATIRFERDRLGRLLREVAGETWVQSHYDVDGSRVAIETSLGMRQHFEFGPTGKVARIRLAGDDPHTPSFSLERDACGHELARRGPGRLGLRWRRDDRGRVVERATLLESPTSGVLPTLLESRRWTWQGEDRLVAVEDLRRERARHYEYDAHDRLILERRADRVLHRAHDPQGNLHRRPDLGDREHGPDGRVLRTTQARYEYDPDGQRIRRIDDEGEWRFEYDDVGMLRTIAKPDGQQIDFEYDALGRRIRQLRSRADGVAVEQDIRYCWDARRMLHEQRGSDDVVSWYWSPHDSAPIAKRHRDRLWSIVADHMGNPTEMYDEQGRLEWQGQLDIYGRIETSVGEPGDCPWRWPGQYDDVDTGLYCNGYRYYDPALGSYTSRDPLGLAGNANAYAYPSNVWAWSDPLGLEQTWESFMAAAEAWNAGEGAATPMSHGFMGQAWGLYQRTLHGTDIPVVGDFGDVARYIDNAGPGHAKLSLPMPPSTGFHWNTFVNDQWMQAFIDRRATVLLASEPIESLLKSERYGLTVFGREMAQLERAGYRLLGRLGDAADPLRMEPPCR